MAVQTFDRPLSATAIRTILTEIINGQRSAEDIAAFLSGLAARGETAEEIAATVNVLREHAVKLPLSHSYELCDTCGTGGDGQGTINVSTLAALVAAAAGVRISKHGNRAASSKCGSADLLEALGVNLDASPAQVARCIEEVGFGFCFAPKFHPAMKAVAPIRKQLGIRTIFNLVGPLANPAPLTFQLVGVPDGRLLQPMAEALQRLGIRHGVVVHGLDGLDEVTTTASTEALEVWPDRLRSFQLQPEMLGLPRATLEELKGGDVTYNTQRALEILRGVPSAQRDLVVANAACALYVAGRVPGIREGVAVAVQALESGAALELLERLKRVSHAP